MTKGIIERKNRACQHKNRIAGNDAIVKNYVIERFRGYGRDQGAFRKESRTHRGRCAGSRTAHDIARTPSDTVRENSVFRLA